MNNTFYLILKLLRKLYGKVLGVKPLPIPDCEQDPDKAAQIIYNQLMDDQPCMIARFGSTELSMMVNYLGIKEQNKSIRKYVQGKAQPWWWEKNRMEQMQRWSGFFPPTPKKIQQFCELMLQDMQEVDVLGSWIPDERYVVEQMNSELVHLRLLEPFWARKPWTRALAGKKVLVVHPFAETIFHQYKNRGKLFVDEDCLPRFESLNVIKAVQTLGQNNTAFTDWFEALQWMKAEIDKHDFDICLIGAGAYGFPLAAHVKRQGKKAVHLGGSLQLLFGIKGKRWEDINYGVAEWNIPNGFYVDLMNKYWVRPMHKEKPKTADNVEGASYW